MDPFYLMLGAQGLSNTLANIGSMQRGRGQVANNAPLLGMAMQYKQQQQEEGRNQKIADSLQNDPSLSDQEKAVLSQVAMNGGDVTGYLARKMAVDAKDERSPFQVVGGSLARIPSDPNGTPEWFTPPSADQNKEPPKWRMTPDGRMEPVPGGPYDPAYLKTKAQAEYIQRPTSRGPSMSFYDHEGNLIAAVGDNLPPGAITQATKSKAQGNIMAFDDGLARLRSINDSFKPEYQTLGGKWTALVSSAKEKAGIPLDPEDQAYLRDFSAYKRNAVEAANLTIKDITGAAMSKDEAERLMEGMPVAGTGLLDGDGPTKFKSKLDAMYKSISAARARYAYTLSKGIPLEKAPPLESMNGIINRRGGEIEKELRAMYPKASNDDIRARVKGRLSQEFGIGGGQ